MSVKEEIIYQLALQVLGPSKDHLVQADRIQDWDKQQSPTEIVTVVGSGVSNQRTVVSSGASMRGHRQWGVAVLLYQSELGCQFYPTRQRCRHPITQEKSRESSRPLPSTHRSIHFPCLINLIFPHQFSDTTDSNYVFPNPLGMPHFHISSAYCLQSSISGNVSTLGRP